MMDEKWRSTDDIRQDIAREEENISRTAHQLGDRLKEKLDWTEYVKNSPYCALGIAVGIGFFASRVLPSRTKPMERILGSLAQDVSGSLRSLQRRAVRPSLAYATLMGIGTKLAADWIRDATSTNESRDYVRPPTEAERYSTQH